VTVFGVFTAAVAVYLHRANLSRLRRHSETQSNIALVRRLGFGRH
jgi:hypothetical protein